jgi:hypothetical protein
MISGLVLKQRKDTGLGMAQTLISSTLSGKVVYSDSALPWIMVFNFVVFLWLIFK